MTMHDFGRGIIVPAHRHKNGGGWVADTADVDPTAYVGPEARVGPDAHVWENAMIRDRATVFGRVYDSAVVRDDAFIGEGACISWGGTASGNCYIYSGVAVHHGAEVTGNVHVHGPAIIPAGSYVTKPPIAIAGIDFSTPTLTQDRNGDPIMWAGNRVGHPDVLLAQFRRRKPSPYRDRVILIIQALMSIYDATQKIEVHEKALAAAARKRFRERHRSAA